MGIVYFTSCFYWKNNTKIEKRKRTLLADHHHSSHNFDCTLCLFVLVPSHRRYCLASSHNIELDRHNNRRSRSLSRLASWDNLRTSSSKGAVPKVIRRVHEAFFVAFVLRKVATPQRSIHSMTRLQLPLEWRFSQLQEFEFRN